MTATASPQGVASRRRLVTIGKLLAGAVVVAFVASKLNIDDEVVLRTEDGGTRTAQGRDLRWQGTIRVGSEGDWSRAVDPAGEGPVILWKDDRWRVRLADGEVLEGGEIEQDGTVILRVGDDTRQWALSEVAWHKTGEEDGWEVRALDLSEGLATIYGRISWDRYVLALVCIGGMYACGIVRWRILLRAQGIFVGLFEATRLTFIGFFFNNVVPGMTGGDVVKAVMIARAHKGRGPDAVSTVIVDRVIGLLVLAALAAVVLLFTFDSYPTIALWVFLLLGAAFAAVCLFLSRRVRRSLRIDRLLNLLPGSETLKRLDQAFLSYRRRRREMAVCLVLSGVAHVFNVLSVWFIGMDLGVDPGHGLREPALLTYFVVVPIIMIVAAVPVLPGGWGVGEAAFGYFFRTVGILNLSLSIGLSVLHRFSMLLWSLLGGVFLLLDRREARQAIHEAQELETAPVASVASE